MPELSKENLGGIRAITATPARPRVFLLPLWFLIAYLTLTKSTPCRGIRSIPAAPTIIRTYLTLSWVSALPSIGIYKRYPFPVLSPPMYGTTSLLTNNTH